MAVTFPRVAATGGAGGGDGRASSRPQAALTRTNAPAKRAIALPRGPPDLVSRAIAPYTMSQLLFCVKPGSIARAKAPP
jgi:hypothetical protein